MVQPTNIIGLRFCSPGKRVDLHKHHHFTVCVWVLLHWFSVLYTGQFVPGVSLRKKTVSASKRNREAHLGIQEHMDAAIPYLHLCYPAQYSSITPRNPSPSTATKSSQTIFQDPHPPIKQLGDGSGRNEGLSEMIFLESQNGWVDL